MFRFIVALVWLALVPVPAQAAEWLAGDGHVHTCYSHDSWCPPDDDNTGPDTFYSSFATVGQRFAEARAKGLDFLVISDHNDVRAWRDPAFGSQGVIGVHAYEASLPGGHAHALGVSRVHERGPAATPEEAAESLRAMQKAIRKDGGMLQANHPGYSIESAVDGCEDLGLDRWATTPMHWRYGFAVRPDTIEVWNPTTLLQPGELLWECWLQRGERIPATAGSDSHGGNQLNLGLPTLYVLVEARSEAAVLEAIRAGRTTITRRPPSAGELRLVLEAPGGATLGDDVPPGTPITARVEGAGAGFLRVRANGRTVLDAEPIAAGAPVTFPAPAEPGWVRASLLMSAASFAEVDPACSAGPITGNAPLATCADDLLVAAMTSPMYVGRRPPMGVERPQGPAVRRRIGPDRRDEPDDQAPIPAVRHSFG